MGPWAITAIAVVSTIGGAQLTGCAEDEQAPTGEPTALERATSPNGGVQFEETVTITKSGFHPRNARVLIGGSVTWINLDPEQAHTAETTDPSYKHLAGGQDSSFDSHTLAWEEPYTVTFHFPETFEYESSYDTWKGTIEVVQRPPPLGSDMN